MAKIRETTMALRFFGDDLDPDEITALLGHAPSVGARKGQVEITKRGTEKVARTGTWTLVASDRQPGDLDSQIAELLTALSDDLSIWEGLASRFESDIFCGLWMQKSNEGISLSAKTMDDLASRKLILDFDIYGPGTQD